MKLLTQARDLQRRKGRERQGRFAAEGVRTVEALLASSLGVDGLLIAEGFGGAPREEALLATARDRGLTVSRVSIDEFESAADTDSPQGVLAIGEIPSWPMPPAAHGPTRWLVLDALQDPGNVGTVIRTAAALGISATVALPGTADPWNAKVVRGSMGALFTHPVFSWRWDALAPQVADRSMALWAAALHGDRCDQLAASETPHQLALVVGNEGAGITPEVAAGVHRHVRIPMSPGVESLNVAAATAILLYALRPADVSSSAG